MAAKNMESSRGMVRSFAGVSALAAPACALLALVISTGCSAPRTFPALTGEQNALSADNAPLPDVITTALQYAHKQLSPNTPFVFNLPPGVNVAAWPTYERMMSPAKPMCPGDRNAWTVRQVEIDGSNAKVQIEYPARDGFFQLVTVHMKGASLGMGYKPDYAQTWRIPVSDPVCNTPQEVLDRTCPGSKAVPPKPPTVPAGAKPAGAAGSGGGGTGTGTGSGSGTKTEEPNK